MNSAPAPLSDKQKLYEKILAGSLCFLPVIGAVMPRALAVLPAAIALLLFLSFKHFNPEKFRIFAPPFILSAILLAMMFATTLWSVDPQLSFEKTAKTLFILLGAALMLGIARQSDGVYFRRWFPCAFLAALALCLVELYTRGIFYFLINDPARPGTEDNLFYLNRSHAWIIILLPIALTCITNDVWPKKVRHGYFVMLALGIFALLFRTNSQSTQLAFLIATAFYFLFPVRMKAAWVGLWALLVTLIFISPWIAQGIFKPLLETAQSNPLLQRGYAANRLEIWDFVARRALERPIFGHGVEATKAIDDFDTQMLFNKSRSVLHPHNFALQLWIEFGIFGPLYAALFFGWVLNGIRRLQPLSARMALAVLFACISIASTGYGMWQGMWIAAYGAAASFCILAAKEAAKEKPALKAGSCKL